MSALSDLALKALCAPGENSAAEPVEKASRVTSFRAESKQLKGYFILVHGQSRTLDAEWVEKLKQHLQSHYSAFEDEIGMGSAHEFSITEVQFNSWTKEQAEFIRQASHQNAELVLAFFKDPLEWEPSPSPLEDHVAIGLEHLEGDRVTGFDIFIHLPQNARFILYTPKGGTFYESQKQKLLSEGVLSVHVDKRSLDEVRRQHARRFIEESSAAFQGI
jgi:hypothetical protein